MNIPFNRSYNSEKEIEYVKDAITRNHISGDGYYTKKVHGFIEQKFGTLKALFVTSCTAALEMAALLLDLNEGDEVILPSYTFVSTANAYALRKAKLVFADINEKTMNIEPNEIVKSLTTKTKAIAPVHYAGVSCDMDKILSIAQKNSLEVVEDAAQGVNALYKNKYLGTIGSIGCYSFHETKNYTCGEGGALLLNDKKYLERAEILREKGTNRSRFLRGEVDKYTWVDVGSSYIASDMLAAYLYAQLEKLDYIQSQRQRVFEQYYSELKPLEEKGVINLPFIPKDCKINYHMFYILLKNESERNRVMDELKKSGIQAIFHYIPLHLSPMGKKYGYKQGDLPITENIYCRILRLPMYVDLKSSEIHNITERIKQLLNEK